LEASVNHLNEVSFSFNDRDYTVYIRNTESGPEFTRITQASRSTYTDPHHRTVWTNERAISKRIQPIIDQAMIRLERRVHTLYLDPHETIAWGVYGVLVGCPNERFFRSYLKGTPTKRHFILANCGENPSRTVEEAIDLLEALGVPRTCFAGFYGLPETLWEIARIHPYRRWPDQHRLMDAWKPERARAIGATLVVGGYGRCFSQNDGLAFLSGDVPYLAETYQAA
jgi:hypothetical protein